jgi:hypothetical protein
MLPPASQQTFDNHTMTGCSGSGSAIPTDAVNLKAGVAFGREAVQITNSVNVRETWGQREYGVGL